MAQVLVRNLERDIVDRLKQRAADHQISLEQELRDILSEAARPQGAEIARDFAQIRAMTPDPVEVDIEALIREDRDR